MAMPVAGDTVRHSAILDIRGWATAVARASQRYLQLALNHRLDELTHPLTQPDFDRVKPIVEKMDRRLCFRLQDRRRRASLAHGVVSTGAPTPGLLWVSPPGDYAIVNSNHIPDGTVLAKRRCLMIEGRATLRGCGILYRSALYPLSDDGTVIDHVLGAANWRPLRENEQLISPLVRTKWL